MKDSTALILASLVFNMLTIWAVIIDAPVAGCAALCFGGAALMAVGFIHLVRGK